MTILHIHDRVGCYGGGEVYLAQLREGLRQRGHRSPVLYLTQEGSKHSGDNEAYYVSKPHGLFSGLRTLRWFPSLLDRLNPDVVHCHCLFSPIVMAWLFGQVPTLFTLHSLHMLPRKYGKELMTIVGLYERALRRLMRPTLRKLSGWIAPSQAFAEEIRNEGYERVSIIPHFTEKRPSSSPAISKPGTILFVGRLSAEKGVEALLNILVLLQGRTWNAVIAGEGPMDSYARNRIAREGLSSRVEFTGWLDGSALDRAYERAAVVVIPSVVKEAFCLVGIEAMAFGKPVVAFDAGGIREWLDNGRTGYLVAQGDCPSFAERIVMLLDNPDRACAMGKSAQQLVETRFRLEPHLQLMLGLYEKTTCHLLGGGISGSSYAYRN
ncbi:MAG: glycosyltransferase family 4 protein [Nitrospira sp.]|jgi:glycosyltransferase involved in cell wall biosynthesis